MNQPSDELDLDAYFRRIGYQGDRTPNLKTLQTLHQCHTQTIAFENLHSLTKQPVLLDLASLQQKLVQQKRGGYCFEQNLLFRSVLQTLGFTVTSLAARVRWNIPEETIMPRTHMLLWISLGSESYIADVGFGGLTLTTPLILQPEVAQTTSLEPFRFIKTDRAYLMQAFIQKSWHSLYAFDLQEQFLSDYEVSNWYVSTHPHSIFVNSLIAAKPEADRRYALRNNQFTIHHLDGRTERSTLATVAKLRKTLEEFFRLDLGAIAGLDQTLQQIIERASSN